MKKMISIILVCLLTGCLFVGCNNNADSTQDEAKEQDITASETVEETTEEATMQFMTTNPDRYYINYGEEPSAPINEQIFYDNSTKFVVTEQYASNQKMISQDGYSIIDGDKEVDNLVLPNEYNGKGIVSVFDHTYEESAIENLVISDTIEYIGLNSFSYSEKLENIVFGENLKKIEGLAFNDCTAIKSLDFNGKLESIWGCAFSGCDNLKKVTFNGNVKLIAAGSFSSCDSLETVEFAGEYEDLVIGNHAFANNPNLKKIYLPEGTVEIGAEAFSRCYNLEEIHIPASVTRFEYVEKETNEDGDEYDYYKNDILSGTYATIYAPKGSVAEQYAKATNREFVAE